MEKLVFSSGIKEYQLGDGGILRFNPNDPNVYARFMEAMDKLTGIEDALVAKAKALESQGSEEGNGPAVLRLMAEADSEIKALLSEIFGGGNDFHKILNGVNLLAVTDNGERVIANLLNALTPILQEGAEKCAQQQIGAAVTAAKLNRAQRRAMGIR